MNTPSTYIHPQAIVDVPIGEIGNGTRIWAFAHVMKNVRIGTDCNVGEHSFLESGVVIGNQVTIKNHVLLWEGVTLKDEVFVGPGVVFTNDLYPRSPRFSLMNSRYENKAWLQSTYIERGAAIGANATILCGITVGQFAMIGAGALVTRDIPPLALALGNPAKVKGWVCLCARPIAKTPGKYICECGTDIDYQSHELRIVNTTLNIELEVTL